MRVTNHPRDKKNARTWRYRVKIAGHTRQTTLSWAVSEQASTPRTHIVIVDHVFP